MSDLREFALQSAAAATGNGTAAMVSGLASLTLQVTGITGDTITLEATVDGTNYVAVLAANLNTGAVATTITANGLYSVPCAGLKFVRARISTYSAGAITVVGMGVPEANW